MSKSSTTRDEDCVDSGSGVFGAWCLVVGASAARSDLLLETFLGWRTRLGMTPRLSISCRK